MIVEMINLVILKLYSQATQQHFGQKENDLSYFHPVMNLEENQTYVVSVVDKINHESLGLAKNDLKHIIVNIFICNKSPIYTQ